MAKQTQSQTTAQANRPVATSGTTQRTTRKQIPQARRGSVTKPVKKTPPWTLIISGGLLVVAVAVVIGVVIANQVNSGQVEHPPTPLAAPAVGAAAPDFSAKASDGSTITKADIAGKPTLMVFFASWCPHCQAEAPKLKALAEANPDLKLVFLGVGDRDTQKDIWAFQSNFSLPVPTYDDGGNAASVYGVTSYPTLVSVDKNGMISDRDTGEVTQDRLNSLVAKAKG
ncbi:MAG: TlpA family protein disulfide reductase [Thermomicrobiales bacterium]